MKRRAAFVILGLLAGCFSFSVGGYRASADIPNVSVPFSFTTTGTGTFANGLLNLAGQSACSITFTSVGTGGTVGMQGSSDSGTTYATVNINGASSVSPPVVNTPYGVQVTSTTASALTQLRINITALSSGTMAGTMTCSAAVPAGNTIVVGSVQVSPIPLPVAIASTIPLTLPTCSAAGIPCVQVSGQPIVQVSALPAVGPTDAASIPYTHPTTQPVCSNTAIPCTQVSGYVAPQVLQTNAAGNTVVAVAGPTASPGLLPENQPALYGSGTLYVSTIGDTWTTSGALTAGTTASVIAAVSNQYVFAYYLGAESTGSQVAATLQFEFGTGAACVTTQTTIIPPTAVAFTGASGQFTSVWSGALQVASGAGPVPAAVPVVSPISNALCVVPAGTTFVGKAVAITAQHA